MPEEYLRIGELAERMRVGEWKIKQLRKSSGLPAVTWGSRTVRYPWGEVEQWIAAQREEQN